MRRSLDDLPEKYQEQALAQGVKPVGQAQRRKHGNIPTPDSTGRVHPSKLQATVTDQLRLAAHAVIPEVSIPLSARPRDRIRIDCLVIEQDLGGGRFVGYFADPKGYLTDAWTQKMRRFEDAYKVPIQLIRKRKKSRKSKR